MFLLQESGNPRNDWLESLKNFQNLVVRPVLVSYLEVMCSKCLPFLSKEVCFLPVLSLCVFVCFCASC